MSTNNTSIISSCTDRTIQSNYSIVAARHNADREAIRLGLQALGRRLDRNASIVSNAQCNDQLEIETDRYTQLVGNKRMPLNSFTLPQTPTTDNRSWKKILHSQPTQILSIPPKSFTLPQSSTIDNRSWKKISHLQPTQIQSIPPNGCTLTQTLTIDNRSSRVISNSPPIQIPPMSAKSCELPRTPIIDNRSWREIPHSPPTRIPPSHLQPQSTNDENVVDTNNSIHYRLNEIGERIRAIRHENDQSIYSTKHCSSLSAANRSDMMPYLSTNRQQQQQSSSSIGKLSAPFISATRNSTSHSLHANMQQLLASLKRQHPTLHRIGLAIIAEKIPADKMVDRFREALQKEIDNYRNRLPILINYFRRYEDAQLRTNVDMRPIVFELEDTDRLLAQLETHLIQVDQLCTANGHHHQSSPVIFRPYHHSIKRPPGQIYEHTSSSLSKTRTVTGAASSGLPTKPTTSAGQLRQLRLLQTAFACPP